MRIQGLPTGARPLLLALGLALGATASPAAGPTLAAIARIEPGQWQIKTPGSSAAPRLVCVANPRALIHFDGHGHGCARSVVVDDADTATVQYRCASGGSGRVTFKVATPRAFDLDLQGLEGGLPYDDHYEAHRLGACTVAAAAAAH